ncbi:hypothetical protein [Actinospica robiniae]|uniref:hypothetical protein n=1 Tax=Actinospica robiniae TaxID=304901 RepID=UPI0012F7D8A5|nr:hypothetical protein [Actinospica robiniae]
MIGSAVVPFLQKSDRHTRIEPIAARTFVAATRRHLAEVCRKSSGEIRFACVAVG